eukprot:3460142-Alexandrium_andersonii.AAC.1
MRTAAATCAHRGRLPPATSLNGHRTAGENSQRQGVPMQPCDSMLFVPGTSMLAKSVQLGP